MVQLGQYAPPRHTVIHLSDPHLLGGGRRLYGAVDTDAGLVRALDRIERAGVDPEAIVVTGDLADLGEPDAYRRLRDLVEPVAERLGARLVWVMGNHDERAPFAEELLREEPGLAPLDRVHRLGDLRIIALDTSVPGFHHGELDDAQLEWLRAELAEPAPDGTILALHHPPLPNRVEIMSIIELQDQHRLAEVLRGTDVRAILGGHLHHSMFGTFAGIPVSVAAATCYTIDAGAPVGTLRGVDGHHAVNIVDVHESGVVHTIVPLADAPVVSGFSDAVLDRLAAMTPEARRAAFSDKASTFDTARIEASGGR